jgi:predicted SAM-dependent methyltransferase
MKLANLGCGSQRPLNVEWTNVDSWEDGGHQIDEPNFVFHDLRNPLPFADGSYDAVLASHLIEHMDCQDGLKLFREAKRILKPGGIFMVSVPDASYFRKVYPEDRNENWPRLFEVSDPPNPIPTFFEAALWFGVHKAILTEDALWAYFIRAGFKDPVNTRYDASDDAITLSRPREAIPEVWNQLAAQLNRLKFSLIMSALKPL